MHAHTCIYFITIRQDGQNKTELTTFIKPSLKASVSLILFLIDVNDHELQGSNWYWHSEQKANAAA